MERKKSIEAWVPVYLVDDTDGKTPETGKTYSDVTVKYAKQGDTSLTTKTMASGDWQELGDGLYLLKFSITELNTIGNFIYEVYAAGTRRFPGHADIVDNIEKDTYDRAGTIDSKLGAFSGAGGDEVKTQLSHILSSVLLYDIYTEVIYATSQDNTRKVAVGKIDRINFKVKDKDASDWSSPLYEGTVYAWYQDLGDNIPYKYGASS